VTVDLCNRVDDSYSGLHLPAGINHIDGRDALAFVRQRHGVPGSDLGREKRQQYFLAAAYRKIASLNMLVNPGKLSNLIDAVKKSIYIDDGFSLVQLAEQMANLSADNIVGQTIPTEGEQIIDGQDVLVVDPAKVQQRVDELINGSSTPSSSSAPASSSSPSQASASTSTSKAPIDSKCIH
jgi:anionic cell wall polymer biosynthesis LytR-Cps2A-Psr (LCP) family protein